MKSILLILPLIFVVLSCSSNESTEEIPLVEKVSDLSLQDYMVKNVFKPLEMNDTSYDIPSHKIINIQLYI